MTPVPLYLITGYLGAGKTSFLNNLLALPMFHGKKLALVINEFGQLNVDGQLLRPGEYTRFDLNRGSLFCVCIKTDFLRTFSEIATQTRPDVLLIEATGAADPCDIRQLLDVAALKDQFESRGTICLVDAVNFTRVLPFMRAARNQVLWADAIVINKVDQVPAEDVEKLSELLEQINPQAIQARTSFGAMAEDFISGIVARNHGGGWKECSPDMVRAVNIPLTGPVSRRVLDAFIVGLDDHLLRMKGFVDMGNGLELFETVFSRVSGARQAVAIGAEAGLTVIVKDMDKEKVLKLFAEAESMG